MGNFVGLTGTGFVGTGEMSAVTSYMPCHLFGDQMLIGDGIRYGFYLLYAAAIFAVLFGVDKQFRFWHGCWGILALALFVALTANLYQAQLVIIDYAIIIELVLWYPVFFFFTVFNRQGLIVTESRTRASETDIRARLEQRRQMAVSERDAARARAYADALKAFALKAAAEEADEEHDEAQAALANSMRTYVDHWHERVEITDGPHHRVEEYDADGGCVTTVYNRELIEEVAAAPTRADVEKFRDLYVAAMMHSAMSASEARAEEQEVAMIAAEELRIKKRARRPKHAVRHFLLGASFKDRLSAALGLLVWSTWMFSTAALYWPLWDLGRKPSCDDGVTVYFVFAPKKPFLDSGFNLFLKIWTVGVAIVAVFTTVLALYFLLISLLGARTVITWTASKRSRKGKRSVEAGHDHVEDHRSSPEYSYRARTQHSQELLDCLHHTDARTVQRRYRVRTTSPIHFSLWNVPWAILLAVLLIITIVTAELTVRRNGPDNNTPLDWARPPLHETAEILALLIGLYALVLTLLSIIGALVASLIRKRRQTHHDVEHHHEYHHHEKRVPSPRGRREPPQQDNGDLHLHEHGKPREHGVVGTAQ
ncbi:hypothetical protein QBC46DRAFT_160965 [Diplogelasinospora grovesii]|uniref:Uncharacterized protein n=1 Tax=Diplogelasinospora grovesii TaxID=303347 RepID=A0AAN6S3I3_9PEZI|nr:hypothetical protein QBC46DRAFT_160965 [Diplogelasinospora grovesii]